MSNNPLVLPRWLNLRNKKLIVIDDIRVTGSHEESVLNLIAKHQPESVCKMYILILMPSTFSHFLWYTSHVALFEPTKGLEKPQHEATLNSAIVKNLTDLDNLIKGMGENYIPNARVCKFLLSQQDHTALKQFLKRQSHHLLRTLFEYMEGDGYPHFLLLIMVWKIRLFIDMLKWSLTSSSMRL